MNKSANPNVISNIQEFDTKAEESFNNNISSGNKIANLYQMHADRLIKYLQKQYGSGPPEPEDIVQEVFAKFGQLKSNQIDNPKAYLYRMAINLTLNGISRVQRANAYIAEQFSSPEEYLEEIGPETVIENRDELRLLGQAINALSSKQREILVRVRLQGETYAQIAKTTGWSQADISRQLHAALATLMKESEK